MCKTARDGIRQMSMSEAKASALTVRPEWDPIVGVWVAKSDDVPGLVTEADTLERLVERLRVLVPGLLELNGSAQQTAPVELVIRLPENSRRAGGSDYLQRDAALVREHVSTAEGDRSSMPRWPI